MVSERRRILLLGTAHFDLDPLRWQIIELGLYKIIKNALLLVVPSMYEHFTGLDTGGKVGSWCDFVLEFQLDPACVDLPVFIGFSDINFQDSSSVIIVVLLQCGLGSIFQLLHVNLLKIAIKYLY